jgi:hypothetical protein
VWEASALADTVAGMVTNQKTAAPITARINARIMSLRSIGAPSPILFDIDQHSRFNGEGGR